MPAYVYMLASKKNGTLYVGVTNNVARRTWEHRQGTSDSFTRRHDVYRLVWYESHADIREAIAREKAIKKWRRAWKLKRVNEMNPEWRDLYDDLNR